MNPGPMVLFFTVYRFRKLFATTVAYLVVLAVVGQLPTKSVTPWAAGLLVVPFLGILFGTIFSFVNIDADIASTTSAYPAYLLRLPIRTAALVLWPTIAVALWSMGTWLALCEFYFHPRGVSMPMIWPGAMFAALALCIEGTLWVPVRFGGLRLIIALLLPASLVAFGLFAASFGWVESKISYVYFCAGLVSLGFAWFAVDRARTSPPGQSSQKLETASLTGDDSKRKVKAAFPSAAQAQFWLEWRRQGRMLPIATGVVLGLFTIPILFNRELVAEYPFHQSINVNVYVWPMLPVLPWIPLLMATAIGMGARRSDMRSTDGAYHLFYATRPLDEEEIYRAKLRSITASVIATSAITIAFLILWLCQPATWNNRSHPFLSILLQVLTTHDVKFYAVLALTFAAWMWRNQAVGAFVEYLPSRFLSSIYPLLVTIAAVGWMIVSSENRQSLQSDGGHNVFAIILGVALAAKLVVAAWYGFLLVKVRPAALQILAWSWAKWIGFACVSAYVLYWIATNIDGGGEPPYFIRMPIPILLGLLIVPLARASIARWALQTGRHR